MGAPDASTETERALVARTHREVDAQVAFHRAYRGDARLLAADAPAGYPALSAWAAAAGVPFAALRADVSRLFLPAAAGHVVENAGAPPPIADQPGQAGDEAAVDMGRWWAWLPAVLEPLGRAGAVAPAARAVAGGGVRGHPLCRALLRGVGEAAGSEAEERARRTLCREAPVARVVGWLGPAAAAKVPPSLRALLAGESEATVRALAEVLERRFRPVPSAAALVEALRAADPGRAAAPALGGSPLAEAAAFAALERSVAETEARATALTGEALRVYFGPPDLPGALTAAALRAAAPARRVEEAPPPAEERERAALPPWPRILVALRAWCRRLAPRLTPALRSRLLVPA